MTCNWLGNVAKQEYAMLYGKSQITITPQKRVLMAMIKIRLLLLCLFMLLATSCAFQGEHVASSQGGYDSQISDEIRKIAATVPPGSAQRVY